MTAPKTEPTSAVYRRCAAAVEKAINAIQENPALYRGRTARNKLVELAAAAKQLDRLLDGNGSDDEDHFGEAFAAAGLDMKAADVDALAACAAAADCDGGDGADEVAEDTAPEATPETGKAKRAAPTKTQKNRRNRLKKKEKKRAARAAAEEADLPPCREIDTPPEVLAALEAADRAATPEPTLPADPSLFKPTASADPAPSKPGGTSSWGRGFLAIGTVAKTAPPDLAAKEKAPDLRDPFAYIASTCDDDLTAPALHDAPSPNFDGLVIEEVTREELEGLELLESTR
ncbi:unnamed protein product [Pelagomonas calceolata]|uniref:Uncharacterized protein n=1 Tax=Pelagomonas calceolata TaxID=35677 RepID=A0A8J2X3N5_9STRA|nr:unnamed protein product [Pelagomonas calceolata]